MTPVTHPSAVSLTTLPDPTPATGNHALAGAELVDVQGRALPLEGTNLTAEAAGGLSRVVLEQTFVNRFEEPLRVTYRVPLPADAAVSGYSFELEGVRTEGRVQTREDARRTFEDAMLDGRAGAILEEDRSTCFEQEIGNVPAGASIRVAVTIDMRLSWLPSSGQWEWRFPTVVAPRYGTSAEAPSARGPLPVADGDTGARVTLALSVEDQLQGDVTSSSHEIASTRGDGRVHVGLTKEAGARLDRDVVVRWPVAGEAAGVVLRAERPGANHAQHGSAFGLLTLVPPTPTCVQPVSRDLVVLIDTSGSMGGAPLAQAVAVTSALVNSLGDHDQLELIEFSVAPRRWKRKPVAANARNRANALRWLNGLRAAGGTEMRSGILEALRPLGPESQRQVVIVSDGLIGFEDEIVGEIRDRLPAASRVHTVGVGHGVNRSLTRAAARAGRGVERILGPDEAPQDACGDLLRATCAPVVVDLRVEGSALRKLASPIRDLFAGAPSMVPVELDPRGGTLRLIGRTATGEWTYDVTVPALGEPVGDGMRAALFARERVEDLEVLGAPGRERAGVDQEIERLGLDFQIATRRTSWVAVSDQVMVDPTAPTRAVTMPHELAAGMSAEGLGLRACAPMPAGAPIAATMDMSLGAPPGIELPGIAKQAKPSGARRSGMRKRAPEPKSEVFRAPLGDSMDDDELVEEAFGGAAREEAMPAPMPSRDKARAGRLQLAGTCRRFESGELTLEFTVPEAFEWSVAEEVEIVFEDGTVVICTVDQTRTTANGTVSTGATLRLTLTGTPERAAADSFEVSWPSSGPVELRVNG